MSLSWLWWSWNYVYQLQCELFEYEDEVIDTNVNSIDKVVQTDGYIARLILSDVGMVTETDVNLAKASNAVLIAFNVKPSKEAKKLAENEKIKISSFNIIYEVLDYVKQKMSGLLAPDVRLKS